MTALAKNKITEPDPVLDQTQDLNGAELYRLARVHQLPPFVKEASSDEVVGPPEGLEQQCFAHPRGKLYPCHTPAATYVSAMFFLDKQGSWDRYAAAMIDQAIDKFAAYHGIRERVDRLKSDFQKQAAAGQGDAVDPQDCALVVDGEGRYPLRNTHEVKAAAQWLSDYRGALPYAMRQEMATRILDKAERYGAGLGDLDTFLEKQAGRGTCAARTVAQFLFNRSVLYKRAGHLDLALQLAKMAKASLENKQQVHEPETLQKLAALVDQADRQTNLPNLVPDLTAPEDVFFVITEKAASRLRNEHLASPSGNFYRMTDLGQASLEPLRAQFGDDFADAVSAGGLFADPQKMAEVIPTLPRGDAETFDRLLASMGIHPVAKEAAHQKGGFDDAELRELAGLHGSF